MSTLDVPGANPANGDALHVGCWAEAADGSLVFVQSTEQNRVIFEVFDIGPPVTEYRDSMTLDEFNDYFSISRNASPNQIKWTWHDKTAMPWDRIIKAGARPVARVADPDELLDQADRITASRQRLRSPRRSAAQTVADDLRMRGRELTDDDLDRLNPDTIRELRGIRDRLNDMFSRLDE